LHDARGQLLARQADDVDMLDHERLDVYECALQLVSVSLSVGGALPRGNAALGDQLRRAAMSVPLNIAEGCGKFALSDRASFYRIARASALERGAALDVVGLLKGAPPGKIAEGKVLVTRVVEMLTKLAQR
jgi:four helix bundle protein